MLHEILMSLLGFTGNIIVRDETTFKVCDEFDLLTIAEKVSVVRVGLSYFLLGANEPHSAGRLVL